MNLPRCHQVDSNPRHCKARDRFVSRTLSSQLSRSQMQAQLSSLAEIPVIQGQLMTSGRIGIRYQPCPHPPSVFTGNDCLTLMRVCVVAGSPPGHEASGGPRG